MINIKKISFGYKKPPVIIAEISGNHSGDKKKFLSLIKSACLNGADLVKIQTYEPQDITLKSYQKEFQINKGIWKNKYLWDLYKKSCTPFDWHEDAFKLVKKYNKILFSSPFSIRAVDFLETFKVQLYKIASFEITDYKLIDYIASKKKPIILSTGMSSKKEISTALKIIKKYHNKVIIMHCVSGYPTKLDETNLGRITELKKKFKNHLIGISDHTKDIISSISSVPLGVVAIEKHFKLDDNIKTYDSEFSITPKELRKLKEYTKKISLSINKNKSSQNEKNVSIKLRRSIFAIKDIQKGEVFTTKNIDTLRPMIGLPASEYFKILGKKSNIKFKAGTAIKFKINS